MADLLPPNATRLERNLAEVMGRLGDVPAPLRTLMNPDTCPAALLPWLAWHLGVDAWKDYWPEQVKRARVKAAIQIACKRGTAGAVRSVVAAFGANIVIREWWEMNPPGAPHTFEVVMAVSDRDGESATAEFIGDVIAEIDRAKPVRSHYIFTQGYQRQGAVAIGAAARAALYVRLSLSDT
ncbi:phage tail protein I [Cupriavidus sp. AcVe19-1a]|uniref:phage tail protein I n=1 Tax=Cupriavidus sp. AcVe19-1a TaxID=2821359 RepID=UPI001AEB68BF|nr:phage tail protein I [Cupriavidus sp. AcVe19-1a]MBP0633293.1 phage tail protein I [Cupriavidus sp. AcVe19-1a]